MNSPFSSSRRAAFTLVELLVVIAIIGVLVALLLPAVQAAREAARRMQCANQVKNLSIACLNYENATGEMPYGRKFNYWDAYTWTQITLPYIEQQAIYDLYWTLPDPVPVAPNGNTPVSSSPIGNDPRMRQAREAQIPVYYCPSDTTPIANEIGSDSFGNYRGNYRGCVGATDLYGGRPHNFYWASLPSTMTDAVNSDGNAMIGAFGVNSPKPYTQVEVPPNRLRQFTDGTSGTLLISEGVAPRTQGWGGPLSAMIYGNMGGALFSAVDSPNSSNADFIIGPCPSNVDDEEYPFNNQCIAFRGTNAATGQTANSGLQAVALARSLHPGGVNASRADGSVHFDTDSVDTAVWRALGTRTFGETIAE